MAGGKITGELVVARDLRLALDERVLASWARSTRSWCLLGQVGWHGRVVGWPGAGGWASRPGAGAAWAAWPGAAFFFFS